METARRAEQSRRDIERNLSVDGAAQYLVVSRSFLNKLRVTGGGPVFFKIGSRIVYALSDLDEWLAARRRTSTADTGSEAA
jgi:predicted DNA-binding transcriptional regulator AlpA